MAAITFENLTNYSRFNTSGTRRFRKFVNLKIPVKRCSEDMQHALIHDFKTTKVNTDYEIFQYVACIYEEEWWIRIILEIDADQDDLQVAPSWL